MRKVWTERALAGFSTFFLLTGLVMVFSASSIIAGHKFDDGFYFLKRHLISVALSFALMISVSKIDYRSFRKLTYPFLLVSFFMLILLMIPGVGSLVGGAVRWFRFGPISFQPAELAKLSLIMYLASTFTKKGELLQDFKQGFLPYIVILFLFITPVLMQPDFGSAVTIAGISIIMIFVAGTRVTYVAGFCVCAAIAAIPLITSSSYRMARMLSFINPWDDPQRSGYQIIQSFVAFGSGGLAGRGLGESKQKLFYIPEPHTDFILPVIGEELGFIGVAVVILLFIGLTFAGIRAAIYAADEYGRNLAIGITSMISLQALLNMGVVMGMLPTKGLPLPFISYGGTALIVNAIGVGLLLSIAARGK